MVMDVAYNPIFFQFLIVEVKGKSNAMLYTYIVFSLAKIEIVQGRLVIKLLGFDTLALKQHHKPLILWLLCWQFE